MKNNIKKAPVKFWEDLLYFQHFMQIFVLLQISDYHHLNKFIYIPVLVVVLLLCSNFHNDVPPEPQQNVSMAAVWGAITCLGHSNVLFIL